MGTKHLTSATLVVDRGEEITELYKRGMTTTRLTAHFGCARNTMTQALMKLGLINGPKWAQKGVK